MLDPNRYELRFVPLPVTYRTYMMTEYLEQNPTASVIQLEICNHQQSFYPTMGLMSCVGVVKYCLGVRWPLVLTPWQLWTKLLKSNAPHIKVINSWLAIDGSGTKT